MKLLLPRFLALSLLAAAPALHAELDAVLDAAQPAISGGASYVNVMSTQGMGWRWTKDAGRRDYGQIFPVKQPFSASELAVQVLYSDPFRAAKRAAFQLDFLRFPSGDLKQTPDVVATYDGTLPPNPGLGTGEAAWLRFRFPGVKFEGGSSYGFLLRFKEEGAAEQNIIFRVTPSSTPDGGYGIMEADGSGQIEKGPSMNFLLGASAPGSASAAPRTPSVLTVDQRATDGYRTLAAATAAAQPGDTIRIAPGSGPYREPLYIQRSGAAEQPITIDGSGETITGFDPLVFTERNGEWSFDVASFLAARPNVQGFTKVGGKWTSVVPGGFPSVLVHHGRRVFQDAVTGQFEEKVRLSDDGTRLILLDPAQRDGWEIAARDRVVVILNASYQTFRNIRATGSLNDGFNLHGTGEGLVFENIEGSQNLDEGFSAHDTIACEIVGGVFSQNDNGIGNVGQSRLVARDIRTFDNTGYGLWFLDASATLENASSWGNGVAQFALHGKASAIVRDVSAVPPAAATKPRMSYEESAKRNDSRLQEIAATARCEGAVTETSAPAPARTAAQ
jgi:hypothetical protein